ncbi:MAG: DUF1614 domain-containing protein [Deltaproteobacteria bacterium]|nr:DUF1614 domain-containing protein [Deltaproteobacteria bacterium]MBW1986373.1 DUF1614 domain-containing protein [Deltaproteobacteria bacterium]
MFYPPLLMIFMLVFFVLAIFLFAFLQVGVIGLAFAKLGLPPQHLFGILLATLLGSMVNIPIGHLESNQLIHDEVVSYFGMRYRVPKVIKPQKTILAINVGGALIPLLISIYLIFKIHSLLLPVLVTGIVALVTNRLARPVQGMGIAIPALIPPVIAAGGALIFSPVEIRAPIAYIAGTMGTLIGADLLKIKELRNLNAPVASIGGAGTFDGVFLSGIIAVLLS